MSRDLLRLYTITIVVKSYRAVAFHPSGTNVLAFVLILSAGQAPIKLHSIVMTLELVNCPLFSYIP